MRYIVYIVIHALYCLNCSSCIIFYLLFFMHYIAFIVIHALYCVYCYPCIILYSLLFMHYIVFMVINAILFPCIVCHLGPYLITVPGMWMCIFFRANRYTRKQRQEAHKHYCVRAHTNINDKRDILAVPDRIYLEWL